MKILNLFSGLGGNRRFWTNHEVWAIEINPDIGLVYETLYPEDKLIIGDVLHHIRFINLNEFDFIWASPPCVSHSCATSFHKRSVPDLRSLFGLKIYFDYQIKNENTQYVIENVQPFYKLPGEFQPVVKIDRHLFWSNFPIDLPGKRITDSRISKDMINKNKHQRSLLMRGRIEDIAKYHNFNLQLLKKFNGRKDKAIRNMCHYSIGEYLLNQVIQYKKMKSKTILSYLT